MALYDSYAVITPSSRCSIKYDVRGSSSVSKCFSRELDGRCEELIARYQDDAIHAVSCFSEYAVALATDLR